MTDAQEALVVTHLPLARWLSYGFRQRRWRDLPRDDGDAIAYLGLVRAALTFRYGQFHLWAICKIRREFSAALETHLRAQGFTRTSATKRQWRRDFALVPLRPTLDRPAHDPTECAIDTARLLATLPPTQRTVLERCVLEGHTREAVGSVGQVKRAKAAALAALRQRCGVGATA